MDESRVGFLRRLIASPSPSGFEQPIQEVIRTEISQYTDVVRTDVHVTSSHHLIPKEVLA